MSKTPTPDIQPQKQKSQFWLEHFQQRNNSKLNKSDYCREYGLSYCQYIYWEQKIWTRHDSPDLIPVQVQLQQLSTRSAASVVNTHQPLANSILCSLSFKDGAFLQIYDAKALSMLVDILK